MDTTENKAKRKRPTTAERLAKLEEKAKQLKARLQAKANKAKAKERKLERKERNAALYDLGLWALNIFKTTSQDKKLFEKNLDKLRNDLSGKALERRERTISWLLAEISRSRPSLVKGGGEGNFLVSPGQTALIANNEGK